MLIEIPQSSHQFKTTLLLNEYLISTKKLKIYANSTNNMNLKFLAIHQMMINYPITTICFTIIYILNTIREYPFLKNAVLGYFVLTSSNEIANTQNNRSFNQSFNRNEFQSFERKHFNQTYYYTRGNNQF